MPRFLVAGILFASTVAARADSQLIALVDPADPARITNSTLQFEDGVRPMMTLELENETALPIETKDIWLDRARFFTKSEAAADHKLWDCGLASNAAHDEPSKVIPPKQRVVVRVSLTASCEFKRDHEHFFVYVSSIGDRVSQPQWKRGIGEFGRLLDAAMPHP
jgi:hypothetical protein